MDWVFLRDLTRLTGAIHLHIHRTWGAESLLIGELDITFEPDQCTLQGLLVTGLERIQVALVPIAVINYESRLIEPISRNGEILPPLEWRLGPYYYLEEILPCP